MKIRILFLIGLFLFCSCEEDEIITSQNLECELTISNTHPKSTIYDLFLENQVSEGLPGISLQIDSASGTYIGASGVSDIASSNVMMACSLHRVGSITKQFTAALVLILKEEGLLSLDEKISIYLPNEVIKNIENADLATVRQCLNHSSGIADVYEIDFWLDYFDSPTRVLSPEEELEYARHTEVDFTAGQYTQYSNTNYILLQLVVEEITNKDIEELYYEKIFEPLNLSATYFSSKGIIPQNAVRGYMDEFDNGKLRNVTNYSFGSSNGTGGIYSTVSELIQFQKEFLTPGRLVSQQTIIEMLTPSAIPFYNEDDFTFEDTDKVKRVSGFGLGWLLLETDYGSAYGHNGGLMGRKVRAWYFPDTEEHIAFCINASGGRIEDISREIFRNGMIELLFE